ncbi:unnamed protein product [Pedinophyceae sp. YPF-701]|nr:unnamed protein product [Pedinophyceae sp. YPF-701]
MDESEAMALLRSHMEGIRAPGAYDRVYKDECMYSFATPESPGGLFINLSTWEGVSRDFLALDLQKSQFPLYVHEVHTRVPLSEEEQAKLDAKPEELAIGTDSGFKVGAKRFKIEKAITLAVVTGGGERAKAVDVSMEDAATQLSPAAAQAIKAVVEKESAAREDEVVAWSEGRSATKYADNLEQLSQGHGGRTQVSMDPSTWKCDETGETGNLWLNLSTGFIGSGRPIWDGQKNIGGNGSALRHYEATGKKYPLAVKLGTITPSGADVYSYAGDEDDMVVDPKLREHLAHWGIDMDRMEKSEKTMAEWQVDHNLSFEFGAMTEAGSKLTPLTGPGLIGLKNLGNSCYVNSIVQLLMTVPVFAERYQQGADSIARTVAPGEAAGSLVLQVAKLARALVGGVTDPPAPVSSRPELSPDDDGKYVAPRRFRALVGKGHAEFSSQRQQDAAEYLQHLLDLLTRAESQLDAESRPSEDQFSASVEVRTVCSETGAVSYKVNPENILSLGIPMEAATNAADVEAAKAAAAAAEAAGDKDAAAAKKVLPAVPFRACLERWAAQAEVTYKSAAAGGRNVPGAQTSRLKTFPPYLFVMLQRYYADPADWTAKKLEVEVEVPDQVDLEFLRGHGPQEGETLQPEDADGGADSGPQPDSGIVAQIVGMGFSENGAKRAALAVNNSSAEQAAEWVFAHMEDPDFNDPPPAPGGSAGTPAADPEAVAMLGSMGFTPEQAAAALQATSGNLEQAADWLFSHSEDLAAVVAAVQAGAAGGGAGGARRRQPPYDGTPGTYELVGFVSHMGSNVHSGHYVAHIKKNGQWVIFNDEKVAASEKPPRGLGYIYLLRRTSPNKQTS